MKVKRIEITEILRSIWLFSANKIKSSESVSKQPTNSTHCRTQLIIGAEIRHIGQINVTIEYYFIQRSQVEDPETWGAKENRRSFVRKWFSSDAAKIW